MSSADVTTGMTTADDEATKLFPKGYVKVKPYLRITPQPNL